MHYYAWGFRYLFFLLLNQIRLVLEILLQDKYNTIVLMINIEFMELGTKRMERLAKLIFSPFLSLAT